MPENSIEGRAEPFLKRVERVLDDLATLKGTYMAEAKLRHNNIKDIYKEAKEEEIPIKALKGLVKYRQLERKQNALAADLDEDDADAFEILVEALGAFADTELGQAALDLAGGGDAKPKRTRKPRSPAVDHARGLQGESPEEQEALEEIEEVGIGDAAASFTVQR